MSNLDVHSHFEDGASGPQTTPRAKKLSLKSRAISAILVALAFAGLSASWSFASPAGSTNDEEFHLANIWCAWGEWEGCLFTAPGTEDAVDPGPTGSVWIPEFLRSVNCYQRGSQSTECLAGKGTTLVETFRQDYGHNPLSYYKIMRTFAWSNDPAALQVIRLMNVLISSLLLGLAVFVSRSTVRRALILSWGIAAIPWVTIYASSTNPSAWAIAGIGTVWAFMLSILDRENTIPYRIVASVGLATSTALAVSGRFDSLGWLAIALSTSFLFAWKSRRFQISRSIAIVASCAGASLAAIALAVNVRRLGLSNLTIPYWNRATDQMHPLLKDALELPWWFASFWGAQPPTWIAANNEPQSLRDGFVSVALSPNLTDSYFPSAVGYLLGFAALALVFAAIPRYRKRNWVVISLLLLVLLLLIFAVRARHAFEVLAPIQNRYFLPWLLVFLAAALTVRGCSRPILSYGQTMLVGCMLVAGGGIAWLSFASRYALNLSGTFTNFGQEPVWWWAWGPSRLVWFLIATLATALWVTVTLRYAAKPLRELDPASDVPARLG